MQYHDFEMLIFKSNCDILRLPFASDIQRGQRIVVAPSIYKRLVSKTLISHLFICNQVFFWSKDRALARLKAVTA